MTALEDLPERVEVLIVGYGPVGAALAGLLGRYGVRVLVVDKAAGIFMAPRAIALDHEALRILQTVGLAEDAFDKVAMPHVKMHSPFLGEFARFETAGSIDCHPKLVTFYQPDLEGALREHVARHPSVRVAQGVEMTELRERAGAVSATLRDQHGAQATVHARYVVGADGAHSRVRQLLGIDFEGESYAEDWLIVDAVGVPENIDHIEFLCDPERPTPHMVAPRGRTRWEFMLKPGESHEEMASDGRIDELLAPWMSSDTVRIERKAVYRFHARSCRRFSRGRAFLAGDAAHITPPFAGQGLVAGLRDAMNLAWKLAWVLRGQASSHILQSYDAERRPHAKRMIEVARFMGRMIMPRSRDQAVMVHGAMTLARRMPFGRRVFDELGMKPKNRFSSGLFVQARGGLGGTWFPQSLVRDGQGVPRPSDDVLGSEVALVGLGGDPRAALSERTQGRLRDAGGRVVCVGARGAQGMLEDLGGGLSPGAAPHGWCVVVRPDRTVLHDGPIADAERVVDQALEVLGAPTHRARPTITAPLPSDASARRTPA